MRAKDIKVGATYRNRGAGRTWRKVQCISTDVRPPWRSMNLPADEPGVQYVDHSGRIAKLYLSSFASWAGSEVDDGQENAK